MLYEINFGYECNLECGYCSLKDYKGGNQLKKSVDPLDIIKFIKRDILENNRKNIELRIVGGESMVHSKKISVMVSQLRRFDINFIIVTNLSFWSNIVEKMFKILSNVKHTVFVSLDSLKEDNERGVNVNAVLENIEKLKAFNLDIKINRVITNESIKEYHSFNSFFEEKGIKIFNCLVQFIDYKYTKESLEFIRGNNAFYGRDYNKDCFGERIAIDKDGSIHLCRCMLTFHKPLSLSIYDSFDNIASTLENSKSEFINKFTKEELIDYDYCIINKLYGHKGEYA